MLNRWLLHYEISSVIVRLITLIVINWSVSAFLGSHYGIDQPIWKWMTICLIFLVSNLLKKKFAATTTPLRMENTTSTTATGSLITMDFEDSKKRGTTHQRSTMVRILILPLTIVVFITMFALLYQVGQLRKESVVLAEKRMVVPVAEPHPGLNNDAEVRVMVFVLSAWTAKGVVKRKEFRETTLQLMPKDDNTKISYIYKFILGQPPKDNELVKKNVMPIVEKEMEEFGDLLILDCSDRYEDLSRKVYSAFEWANQYDFDYFIKTDDDIFVRWDTISQELELAGRTNRYWRGLAYW
ncbi:hypothetical protein BDF20DRAFT_97489 [Mycotypha africana]|uniref:uncharacterized protein n=1 Tax=Mycotypha africana TaxID=64632 RepID=UPI002300A115|nr:uncharacterized protein BDF20DRAFT_97489 [Mycotypha africana]KAI8969983.1 hypothetical protein BDF20DRAFT_97489 [Mycotypha africana]